MSSDATEFEIGLTGDVMLGRKVDERQRDRPVDAVWGDVLGELRTLDALVINLECCLSDRGSPWTRTRRAFHFRADPDWSIPALEAAGVDACALANNHVLDFEEPALRDTLDHLDEAGIARGGAGETLDEALEPARFDADGLDVAVVSLTDNTPEYAAGSRDAASEPSLARAREDADESSPGTARIEIDRDDPETRQRAGEALDRARASDPDLLLASLHWGPNMVEEPPEEFREFARWLIEEGVDAIHGHSAHVFHGVEVYDGRPVIYDAGDFVDDYVVDDRLRNDRSFLFVLTVDEDGTPTELRLRPIQIEDREVHRADEEAAAWSRDRMRSLSAEFGTEFERESDGLALSLGSGRPETQQ